MKEKTAAVLFYLIMIVLIGLATENIMGMFRPDHAVSTITLPENQDSDSVFHYSPSDMGNMVQSHYGHTTVCYDYNSYQDHIERQKESAKVQKIVEGQLTDSRMMEIYATPENNNFFIIVSGTDGSDTFEACSLFTGEKISILDLKPE